MAKLGWTRCYIIEMTRFYVIRCDETPSSVIYYLHANKTRVETEVQCCFLKIKSEDTTGCAKPVGSNPLLTAT